MSDSKEHAKVDNDDGDNSIDGDGTSSDGDTPLKKRKRDVCEYDLKKLIKGTPYEGKEFPVWLTPGRISLVGFTEEQKLERKRFLNRLWAAQNKDKVKVYHRKYQKGVRERVKVLREKSKQETGEDPLLVKKAKELKESNDKSKDAQVIRGLTNQDVLKLDRRYSESKEDKEVKEEKQKSDDKSSDKPKSKSGKLFDKTNNRITYLPSMDTWRLALPTDKGPFWVQCSDSDEESEAFSINN